MQKGFHALGPRVNPAREVEEGSLTSFEAGRIFAPL
jgi:hypothetical protein